MKRLTKAEEEIMHLIWEFGPTTVTELIDRMGTPKPPHSSISSIVRLLEKKEFVDHKAYGRTYEYFPIVEKSTYSKFSLKRLVGQYFEGSMNELVSFLVKEDDISIHDLKELTKRLDEDEIKTN